MLNKKSQRNKNFVCSILGFLLLVLLPLSSYNVYRGFISSSWPTVAGIIRESEIESRHTKGDRIIYSARVVYEYSTPEGLKSSTSIRAARVGASDTFEMAASTKQKYPVGSTVPVFVNPSDSSDAVLENGLPDESLIQLGILLSFLIFEVLLIKYWK
jgi:hypothetical protein